jgi:hypothetical protein
MNYAIVSTETGLPSYTISIETDSEVYKDGHKISEKEICYLFDELIPADEFIKNYYRKDDIWKIKSERPQGFYSWSLIEEGWVLELGRLKIDKATEVNANCKNAIIAGFNSSGLGVGHLYPSNPKDQANLVASVIDSLNPANDDSWLTPFWCADYAGKWSFVMHTKAQIQRVGADGKAHIVAQLMKNAELQAQLELETTEEEINLIVW